MANKQLKLITESTFDIQITESKEDKSLYIMGVFSSAEVKNGNGRIYPKNILEREIEKIQEGIKNRTCLGQLSHPTDSPETDLEKAAIVTEEVTWKGDDIYGRAKVLNTPCGNILKGLISDGVKVGISSRGLGTVSESGQVNSDFRLLTWDIVSNASNPKSKWVNGVYEGKTFTVIDEEEIDENEIIKPTDEEIEQVLKEHETKIWQVLENIGLKK